jgi:M6 family metalloprotease-like protein
MTWRICSVASRSLAVLAAAQLLSGSVPTAAQGQATTLTGTLTFVWGDPQADGMGVGGMPQYRAWISRGVFERYELDLMRAEPELRLRAMTLNGHTVAAFTTRLTTLRDGDGDPVLALHRLDDLGPSGSPTPTAYDGVGSGGLLRTTRLAAATVPEWATVTRPYAIVLCKFADIDSEPRTIAQYRDAYSAQPGGTAAFYTEVSTGRLSITGTTVFGWYRLPKARAEYVGASADLSTLQRDCVAAADADVNFRAFGGLSMHFNSALDCCAWGGSSTVNADGASVTMPTMWMPTWATAGVIWHEMGHSFGLPHSGGPYGHTYDSAWDVMSSAGAGVYLNALFGRGGAHFVGYHKDRLGLIPYARRVEVAGGTYRGVIEPHEVPPNNANPLYILIPIAGRPGAGYSVEARTRVGFDRALPGKAVVINSIVPGRAEPAWIMDADGNGSPNDHGAMWTVGETFEDRAAGIRVTIDSLASDGFGITITNTGAAASPLLQRAGVSLERAQSDSAWVRDSVRVVAGQWRARTALSATWLRVETATGVAGSHVVFSTRGASALPGRNVDTLRVDDATGAAASTAFTVELGVTLDAVTTPRLLRTGLKRRLPPNFGYCDSLTIVVPSSSAPAWTATRTSRLYLQASSSTCTSANAPTQRTGSGAASLRFYHFAPPTAGSLYIDTVTVTVAGVASPLLFVDTAEALAVPVGTLTRSSASRTATVGAMTALDSVQVSIPGDALLTQWTAFRRRTNTTLLRSNGRSGDWLVWRRIPTTSGLSVDTIFVNTLWAGGLYASQRAFIDSITGVDAAPRLQVSRPARSVAQQQVTVGAMLRHDSAMVELIGSTAATSTWYASSGSPRVIFRSDGAFIATASNTGSKWAPWTTNLAKSAPGTYIDTIVVRVDGLAGSPATFVDTVVVNAPSAVAGDVNKDGAVTTADALLILRSLVGLAPPAGITIHPRGDANCDGSTTAADALTIIQLDLGVKPATSCVGRALTVP